MPPDAKRHPWGRTVPFTLEWYEACNNAFVAQMRKYHPLSRLLTDPSLTTGRLTLTFARLRNPLAYREFK